MPKGSIPTATEARRFDTVVQESESLLGKCHEPVSSPARLLN